LPLLPDHRPEPVPDPLLKVYQHRWRLASTEVSDPASQIAAQLLGHLLHAHAPRPPRQFPNLRLEPEHRFGRNPPSRLPVPGKAEAQKLPFPWPCHRTLLLVHLALELRRDESRNAGHHALPRPSAANVDIAIIRIPREPEASPLQLPVELIEHDITQQGRQWSALRRPLIHRTHQPAFHHPGFQKRPDQLQHAPIADPGFDSGYQFVVRNPVEEFLQIQVHYPAITLGDILLRRCHRLMCRTPGPKPVAVIGKRPIPPALQYLHHRLLDESIQHRRDTKLSYPSVRLGDFHPLHRLRLIGPAQQLFPNGWPMLL